MEFFYAKLLYGIEVWGCCPKYLRQKPQTILMKAARLVIGRHSYWWSINKILATVKWLSVDDLVTLTSTRLAHQMLHRGTPETMSLRVLNRRTNANTRLSGPNKLGPRTRDFGGTLTTKYQFRATIYDQYDKIPEPI